MADRDPFDNPQPLIKRIYSYVAYRVGDGADAEDITSAAFERAIRYRHTFDPARGDAVSWLIGIAARCVSDHFAHGEVPVGELPDTPAPGELATDSAGRIDLQRAVARLTERERDLVALRYGADLTARQIAELHGVKTNAVEVALHRTLRGLREALEQPDRSVRPTARELKAAE